jgi:hypothetical protein
LIQRLWFLLTKRISRFAGSIALMFCLGSVNVERATRVNEEMQQEETWIMNSSK